MLSADFCMGVPYKSYIATRFIPQNCLLFVLESSKKSENFIFCGPNSSLLDHHSLPHKIILIAYNSRLKVAINFVWEQVNLHDLCHIPSS